MIKSISYNEPEIQNNILKLHSEKEYYELDPCYSKGVFYERELKEPRIKFDIKPQTECTEKADVRNLPLENNSVESIIFDPPFIIGLPNSSKDSKSSNRIFNRFGGFFSKQEQSKFYRDSLKELYRILKKDGIIAFKCQDTVCSGKQYLVHAEIINIAEDIGFYVKDLFVLLAKSRMKSGKWKVQRHARKYHCYYLVLTKKGGLRYCSKS